jgi:spore germination protein YaaH
VINGWITIDSATALPVIPSPYPDTVHPRNGTPARMAIVTSWHGEDFHAEPIRLLGRDPRRLARAAGAIARNAETMRYTGLVLDFESLNASDLPALLRVSRAIADSARAHRVRTIAMAIPATDNAAYPVRPLLGVVDALVVMLYDQHWAGSDPGPIADPSWVRGALAARVAEGGANRLIAALPAYGYRWRKGRPTESISFAEATRMARADRAPLTRDANSQFLRSRAANGSEIWISDATLLAALVKESQALGVNRFAIWRLGQEDPAIWSSVIR